MSLWVASPLQQPLCLLPLFCFGIPAVFSGASASASAECTSGLARASLW